VSFGAIFRASTYAGAALIGAAALAGACWADVSWAAAPQMETVAQASAAEAAPALACRALSFQTCYFRVTQASTGRQQVFGVKGGAQVAAPELTAGRDRYMLSVNRLPPASEESCGGQFDKRYSLWCRKGVVRAGING
jgi:hypothetical protein